MHYYLTYNSLFCRLFESTPAAIFECPSHPVIHSLEVNQNQSTSTVLSENQYANDGYILNLCNSLLFGVWCPYNMYVT